MPTLHLQLLGNFNLRYDDAPLTGGQQARVQSLLAYLLLHRHAPQSRQHIAFLFWPDSSETQARANLRQRLHYLHQALPDADRFLALTPKTVQWRADAPFVCDVVEFERQMALAAAAEQAGQPAALQIALEAAAAWYGGDLLPGCYDDWILPLREQLREQMIHALDRLVRLCEEQRAYAAAIDYGRQLLRHDPLHEPTYRSLMRLHVLNGDRASALRVYHVCATVLERELGVAPNHDTQAAYERLLNMAEPPALPKPARAASRLVGRQAEWRQLQAAWQRASRERVHFALIAGEAGIGKTRLAEEMLVWAGQQGVSTAYTRAYASSGGLAFAPVIDWLHTDALRQALARLDTVWLTEIARLRPELLVERPDLPPPERLTERWQRQRLSEALARAFLAGDAPLLLVIDDLQWCDPDTLEWLHYLLRHAHTAGAGQESPTRLLVIGTLRPEEVDSEDARWAPLAGLRHNLRRSDWLTEIALGPLDAQETALLAGQEAGVQMDAAAGQRLYRETEGNPLFVVETVRAAGDWRATPEDAAASPGLPAKVQEVIQARLDQLSPPARKLVSLAAVIGRFFTFDVLAQAGDDDEDERVRGLDELWQRRIVREQGAVAYDFSHDRIREVAYAAIPPARRRQLHRRVAQALETRYAANLDAVAGQVAMHYEQAGLPEQAIPYYQQAAAAARNLLAYGEATAYLHRGLALLADAPATAEHEQQELALRIALGAALSATQGHAAPEVGEVYHKAHELCRRANDPLSTFAVQQGLRIFYGHRGEWPAARAMAAENLALAQEIGDAELCQYAHLGVGVALHSLGELRPAQDHFEQALRLPVARQRFDHLFYDDALQGTLRTSALTLWLLGYADQGRAQMAEALALGQANAESICYVLHLYFALRLHYFLQEQAGVQQRAEEIIALCTKQSFAMYLAAGTVFREWLRVLQGEASEGIARLQQTIAGQKASGRRIFLPYDLALLGEAHLAAGQYSEGLAVLQEAQALAEETGERIWQAELHRRQGELLRAQGAPLDRVEACYEQAIALARQQQARALELRATVSLARLWQSAGRPDEARDRLAAIVGWFTEGFDTADLQEAQALLAHCRNLAHEVGAKRHSDN